MPRTSCRNTGYQNELEDVLRVLTGTWTISYDPAPVQDVCPPAHRRKVFLLSEIVGEGKMRNATVLERREKWNPMDLFTLLMGGLEPPVLILVQDVVRTIRNRPTVLDRSAN